MYLRPTTQTVCSGAEAEVTIERMRTLESGEALRGTALDMAMSVVRGELTLQPPTATHRSTHSSQMEPERTAGPSGATPTATDVYRLPTDERELSASIGLDAPDMEGKTALFTAVVNENVEMARTLVERGASVDARAGREVGTPFPHHDPLCIAV